MKSLKSWNKNEFQAAERAWSRLTYLIAEILSDQEIITKF